MPGSGKKTIGKSIDEIVAALEELDDSARITAVRAACEHLGINLPSTALISEARETPPVGNESSATPEPTPAQLVDIRTLKEKKQPTNAVEMACLVAYYLEALAKPAERKKEVTSADMEKYFKQAGFRVPKRMPQLLVNARSSGYFDSAGHAKYKLNPVGYNLVVHSMPRARK